MLWNNIINNKYDDISSSQKPIWLSVFQNSILSS